LDQQFKEFRLSESLKTIYTLIWDDFCSWYLEWIKPGIDQPIEKAVYEKTVIYFEQLMQLLHPFMPFITEEVYHKLKERNDDITIKQLPPIGQIFPETLDYGILLIELITAIRDAKNKQQIKPKDQIKLYIKTTKLPYVYDSIKSFLQKQLNAESINYTDIPIPNSISLVVQNDTFFIESKVVLNKESQRTELLKDLEYLKGFLESVEKKLSNVRFVQNAKPEVIEIERKKKADAEMKIKIIEESLTQI
jgi:valyl-tRNA synthetase